MKRNNIYKMNKILRNRYKNFIFKIMKIYKKKMIIKQNK